MPSDRQLLLPIGSGGLNLRASPAELAPGELTDALNWQIDQNGALVKRLGVAPWSVEAPAGIITLMTLQQSGGATYILAHTDDGNVYRTIDGTTWGSIDTGLGDTPLGWVQYLDKIYYCDGEDPIKSWDGTTLVAMATADVDDQQTITITGTPTGGSFVLTLDGATTAAITSPAWTAADVRTAIAGLGAIGTGNVTATGGPLPGTPVVVTFTGTSGARPQSVMGHVDSFTGGTAPATAIAHTTTGAAIAPVGRRLAIWRNRLWVASGRRVDWSAAGDPTSWITKTNFVSFPDDTEITAIAAAQNVATGVDNADGVLVFTRNRMHRIYDDTDNIGTDVTGGANVLVDTSSGCVSQTTVAAVAGRIFYLSDVGVFSTDGHNQARPEGTLIDRLVHTFSWGLADSFCGFALDNRYYLAFTPSGAARNTRLLECYTDMPRSGDQWPWMAHDIAVQSAVVLFEATGPQGYIADASDGDGGYVRRIFQGNYDVDGLADRLDISARARSGAQLFGITGLKRVRRADVFGKGALTLSVSADLSDGVGEARSYDLRTETRDWDPTDTWGTGVWGAGGGAKTQSGWYTTRGRFFTFELNESSQDIGTHDRALGYAGSPSGGAAALQVVLKLTPLDGDG